MNQSPKTSSDTPLRVSADESTKLALAIPLLLIAATVATYWPILFNGFVRLDDPVTVYQNDDLIHLSPASVSHFWTQPYRDLYAPLTYTLFACVSLVARVRHHAGESPADPFYAWPFHAMSLLLHVICVLLVYALLRRLIRRDWPAAAGALLFALHPVQVESVAWVTETNTLLCTALALSTLLLYLRISNCGLPLCDKWGRFALATEFFILAMLAKPLGVVVPALAGVLFWLMRSERAGPAGGESGLRLKTVTPVSEVLRRAGLDGEKPGSSEYLRDRRLFRLLGSATEPGMRPFPANLLIWIALAIPMAIIARRSQQLPQWWLVVPVRLRLPIALDALAFYMGKIIFPATLTPDYDRSPAVVFQTHAAYYTWIAPVAIIAGIVMLTRRGTARPLVAGALWFAAAVLPVLGLTPFAFQRMSTVADRYLYLPMVGVALCGAWAFCQFFAWTSNQPAGRGKRFRVAMAVICLMVLVGLGIRTSRQCRVWHDTQTLFSHSEKIIGRGPGAVED